MGLTYVGGTTAYAEGATSGNLTVSLTSLTGGSGTAPQENDLVIVSFSVASVGKKNLSLVSEGYYRWCDLFANDNYDTNLWVFTKQMGANPDTSVVVPPSGSANDSLTVMVQVWRPSAGKSVFLRQFLTAFSANSGQPLPPKITPAITSYEDGGQVICIGASAYSTPTDFTSSQLSNFMTVTSTDSNSSMLGGGSYEWSSDLFTPLRFGGGASITTASWCAVSFFIVESPGSIELLDIIQHDTTSTHNSLAKIDDTHFMLAYYGSSGGTVKTFSIDSSYDITEIDSISSGGRYNSLIKIDDTHFILASSLSLIVYSIDGSYNITQVNSLTHETTCEWTSLVKIDDTHFILAYTGADNDGYIKTFSMDGSYNLTEIDAVEHDIYYGYYNNLFKLDDTHFCLAYMGRNLSGDTCDSLKTFSVDGSYNITQIDVIYGDSLTPVGISASLLDSSHLASLSTANTASRLSIHSIDESYDISLIEIVHMSVSLRSPSLVKLDDNHLILATQLDKQLKMFYIEDDYTLVPIYDFYDSSGSSYSDNSLVVIDENHLIMASSSGDIRTFSVNEVSQPNTSNFFHFF